MAGRIVLKFGVRLVIDKISRYAFHTCYEWGRSACSYVRTSFPSSGSTERILKFGVVWPINYAFYSGHEQRVSACAHVQLDILFNHICSLCTLIAKRRLTDAYNCFLKC